MAIQKIDYEDKIGLQNDPNVPDKNKVLDEDMNEIKSVVNNNADELTTAQQNIENLQTGQGTASGDITSLKNRVTTLETDNTTNKQDISSLKSRTTTLETDNETNKTNISTLQEDVEEIEGNITEIQETQTAQNKEIQELDDNQIHITTEKSSNINVQDCSGQNEKIGVFGISEQKTRSGKNKLKLYKYNSSLTVNGVTITINQDGTIKLNGTATKQSYIEVIEDFKNGIALSNTKQFELDTSKKYMFSIKKKSGTFTPSNFLFALQSTLEGTTNTVIYLTGQLNKLITNSDGIYRGWLSFPSGSTFNNFILAPQIEEGEVETDYEQYGAMPSPEFKSDIENVEGNADITVCNKNFAGGIWINGLYNTEGVLSNQNGIYRSIKVFLKKGIYKYSSTADLHIARNINLTEKTLLTILNQSFTLERDAEISIGFRKTDGSAWNLGENLADIEFQLEKGSTATEYVAHEQQLITFSLAEGQKLMEGDYLADDGIHHKRKQVVLDGTENWQLNTTNTFIVSNFDNMKANIGLCSHYKFATEGLVNVDYGVVIGPNHLYIKDKDINTVEEFKTYLAQQKANDTPVVLEYEPTEEEIEQYTEEQQTQRDQLQNAKTYKTITNVFTENAEVEMEYIADTKIYVDNEINSIKNQLNTINELLSTTNTSALLLNNLQTDLESEVL